MPVLPEVASRIVRWGVRRPDVSPSRIMRAAARSFTDPPGFCHSACPYSSTPTGISRSKCASRTRGVRPIMSRTVEPGARSTIEALDDDAILISDQRSPDSTKTGGWLFRHRTSIPVPFALALLFLRVGEAPFSWTLVSAGAVLTLAGEAVRLWAVHHIGTISRTRSDRLGPLVTTGPFGLMRNPLYL